MTGYGLKSAAPINVMTDDDQRSDESRENFAYFSNEYAQALQAFKTIEAQSSTLMLMGVADELHGFIDQFITHGLGDKIAGRGARRNALRGMVRRADPQSGGTAERSCAVAGCAGCQVAELPGCQNSPGR